DESNGLAREQFKQMLNRCRDPLWRREKYHKFAGTDLDVYKPGNTAQRLAGWVNARGVYVAELYPNHDLYERDLPGHRRADYDVNDFVAWKPAEPLTENEDAAAGLMMQIERERVEQQRQLAEARRDAEEAMSLASAVEKE